MKAAACKKLRVGWYLEPPFRKPSAFKIKAGDQPVQKNGTHAELTYQRESFQSLNWWNEKPWLYVEDHDGKQLPKPIRKLIATEAAREAALYEVIRKLTSREAALYEVIRRHPKTGELLCGRETPANAIEEFLLYHSRVAWPWLSAEARESFRILTAPKKGQRSRRPDHWLEIITAFEGTEQGRVFEFHAPVAKVDAERNPKLIGAWVSATKRRMQQKRDENQKQRRAFDKICDGAWAAIVR